MSLQSLFDTLKQTKGKDYFDAFVAFGQSLIDTQSDIQSALLTAVTATSVTSFTIGTGQHVIVLDGTDTKEFVLGQRVNVANTSAAFVVGVVDSYVSGTRTLTFTVNDVTDIKGSGTFASWTVSLSGDEGPAAVVDETQFSPEDIPMGFKQHFIARQG